MTVTAEHNETAPVPPGHVRLTIDEVEVVAPKGELVIRAAERLGIIVPRFCDHPLLDPAGACRQCLVDVEMGGRPMPKPQASCTLTVADGMVVRTQHTSPVADKAQQGVMELLLINHPLDCPVCDKGGECPLQNQALKHGRTESRFTETKRTFAKPIPISSQVLLDRERCVLCQRCTRFSEQIAGDPFIDLLERGSQQQIGVADDKPFQSYFSGNTIQICPVGALTSAAYRFRSRPFDLVSKPGVCEHCAGGCALRADTRRGTVLRRLAGDDPEVNEEWLCDKGRFAFVYPTLSNRIRRPLIRDAQTGQLKETSWTEALRFAAEGLSKARDGKGIGVLPGGRLTLEDAYAYSKFARIAARTNDIDFRSRPHSDEELSLLAAKVVGVSPENGGVTYRSIESAPAVLCVGLEVEEEAGILFLRLRKAARNGKTKVFHLGQYTTPAVSKTFGQLIPAVPGQEPAALTALSSEVDSALRTEGAVLLLGARAVEVPGLISAAVQVAEATSATLAWIPRRAGERGAIEVGALPTLLPGGRVVTDPQARTEVELAWGMTPGSLPAQPGRDAANILTAAANGELDALVVGGVDPADFADPAAAQQAIANTGFLVSLELRESAVTAHADVVLPVAASTERAGSYLNWEGRHRPFETALEVAGVVPDCRVLDTLAIEMDADLFTQTPAAAQSDMARIGEYRGVRADFIPVAPGQSVTGAGNRLVLASWPQMLDNGSLQEGEPHLAGTARAVVARLSESTAARLGVVAGEQVAVQTERGTIAVPLELADLPDNVVWLPSNSGVSTVRSTLGVGHGALVTVSPGRDGGQQ